ncbi:hypothetical protein [Kitasatospora sp. LaBMicrA B282]|uniref:hypothetical protein n=1 Tax=Kitasatospora sp. LaBMicrA B282 TaxID=3420949 RepID=UPI003D0B76AE
MRVRYLGKDDDGDPSVIGSWGAFTDPAAIMANIATNGVDTIHHASWAQPFTNEAARDPHDTDGKLGCGTVDQAGMLQMLCAWADHATTGTVGFTPVPDGMPSTLTMDQAAELTRTARDAMTVPR